MKGLRNYSLLMKLENWNESSYHIKILHHNICVSLLTATAAIHVSDNTCSLSGLHQDTYITDGKAEHLSQKAKCYVYVSLYTGLAKCKVLNVVQVYGKI
jgi:hypothetical protein